MTDSPARETKSPIKNRPVHMPGQSSRAYLDHYLEEKILFPGIFAFVIVVMAGAEWYAALTKTPRAPWMWTFFAVIIVAVVSWRIRAAFFKAKQLHLGVIGEEAVGQYLDEHLRPLGCQVLHDIPAEGFNVDHVVIGPTGVFAIETKTHSKPAKGASSVRYDGETISVNGFQPDRDPVVQATAEARWLFDLLERSTGRKIFVQPVVLYPGWFVEPQPANAEVWVLNEKALPTFIRNARKGTIAVEDVHLLAYHLTKHVLAERK